MDVFKQSQNSVNKLKEWLSNIAEMPVQIDLGTSDQLEESDESLKFLGTQDYDFELEKKNFPILAEFVEKFKIDLIGSRRKENQTSLTLNTIPGESDEYSENDERNAEDAVEID